MNEKKGKESMRDREGEKWNVQRLDKIERQRGRNGTEQNITK